MSRLLTQCCVHLQIVCTVSAESRAGTGAVTVNIGGRGLARGDLTVTLNHLTMSDVSPAVISSQGGTQIVITGAGFDSVECSNNAVTVNGVAVAISECSGSRLVGVFPGVIPSMWPAM